MTDVPKNHTHTVYAYQRIGRKQNRLLEVGSGYIDRDRDIAHVVMNRQPIGGYTGYVILSPHGVRPPPQDPDQTDQREVEGNELSPDG
jgi:hypothetical protein